MENTEIPLPCAEKITYETKSAAEGAAAAADWQHGARLKTYRCQYCDLWHLASE
jgi:hypothetical protein